MKEEDIIDPVTGIVYVIREVSPQDSSIMQAIGKFRYDLWNEETTVNKEMFPDGVWIEKSDAIARHWVVQKKDTFEIVAVARMTFHLTLEDNLDGYLWVERGLSVPSPSANISKLAVHRSVRKLGIGKRMSEIRLEAAKDMGAKSVLVTASTANARLLYPMGFQDMGIRVCFPNRPEFEFLGLEFRYPEK